MHTAVTYKGEITSRRFDYRSREFRKKKKKKKAGRFSSKSQLLYKCDRKITNTDVNENTMYSGTTFVAFSHVRAVAFSQVRANTFSRVRGVPISTGFPLLLLLFFHGIKKKNSICPHTTDHSMISRLQQVLESNLWLPAKDCDTIMILVLGRFCQRSGFIAEMNFPCSSQNISRKVVTLDFSERKLSLVYKSNLERNQKEKDTGRKKLRKAKEKDRQKKRRQKERLKERNPDFILYISKYDHHGESSFPPPPPFE